MLLDELIDRYTEGALLVARPYTPDNSGEILRWIVEIDGEDLPDADILTRDDPEHPDWIVMLLVRGDEELEIDRWSTTKTRRPHGPPTSVPRTLGQLRRGYRQG
jgi:hypothetical protein